MLTFVASARCGAQDGDTALDTLLLFGDAPKWALVLLLLRALALCGGPIPRGTMPAMCNRRGLLLHCLQDESEGEGEGDEEELMRGRLRRARHWREAAALQRRRLVVEATGEGTTSYDPDVRCCASSGRARSRLMGWA